MVHISFNEEPGLTTFLSYALELLLDSSRPLRLVQGWRRVNGLMIMVFMRMIKLEDEKFRRLWANSHNTLAFLMEVGVAIPRKSGLEQVQTLYTTSSKKFYQKCKWVQFKQLQQLYKFDHKSMRTNYSQHQKTNSYPNANGSQYLWIGLREWGVMISPAHQCTEMLDCITLLIKELSDFKSSLQFNKSIIIFDKALMNRGRNDYPSNMPSYFFAFGHSPPRFVHLQQLGGATGSSRGERGPAPSPQGKGKWNFDEQKQYVLFLHSNSQEMRQKSSRKSNKVFLKMSQQVKTRSADQCRSHHQKVLKYHHSIEEIIQHYTHTVYSSQLIFGTKTPPLKTSIHLRKTGLDEDEDEDVKLWAEGNTVRIFINADCIADY